MNRVSLIASLRRNVFAIFISIVAALVVLWKSGLERTFLLALIIGCAYLNALFLRDPAQAFRSQTPKSIAILLGMAASNVALIMLQRDLLISFLVWLPAIAGVLAARLFGRQRN
jgi:hypothetical protein